MSVVTNTAVIREIPICWKIYFVREHPVSVSFSGDVQVSSVVISKDFVEEAKDGDPTVVLRGDCSLGGATIEDRATGVECVCFTRGDKYVLIPVDLIFQVTKESRFAL